MNQFWWKSSSDYIPGKHASISLATSRYVGSILQWNSWQYFVADFNVTTWNIPRGLSHWHILTEQNQSSTFERWGRHPSAAVCMKYQQRLSNSQIHCSYVSHCRTMIIKRWVYLSDATRWHRFGLTLPKVKPCCLTAPSLLLTCHQ